MLGKSMWFATVCTLAFAICGRANRDKGAAGSQGITEDLEHRLMHETNFKDHLLKTTNVSSTPLRKPSSKLYSALRKLSVIPALSSALTADAFTSPGVQPSGVRPLQKVSNTAFAPRLPPGAGESAPSTATRLFSSESPSEGVEEFASPLLDEKALLDENSDRKETAAATAVMTKPKQNMAEAEAEVAEVAAVETDAPAAVADADANMDAAPVEDAAPAEIIPEGPQKVPCFGATPFYTKEPIFFGENYWDKITMEWGSADTGKYIRAAELKHGRAAMLGVLGFAFHKLGFTLNNISPHEYLSVTQGIKFADLQAMTPMEAVLKVPIEGYAQVFGIIAAIELYELNFINRKFKGEETVAPGLQPGGLTGDLGWNPLQVAVTDDRRLAELQNARLAMVCICAWLAHDAVPGSVPIPFPW